MYDERLDPANGVHGVPDPDPQHVSAVQNQQ
jgi:hypothetical protein